MLKAKFKNMSLKKKMLLFYAFSFILPLILLSIVIYKEVSESMVEKTRYSSTRSYEQAKDYLEYRMLQTIYLSDVVVTNSTIKDCLTSTTLDIHEQLAMRDTLRRTIQSIESSKQYLDVKIYIPDHLAGAKDGDYIFTMYEAGTSGWYAHKGDSKVYFAPDIYLDTELSGKKIALVRDIVSDDDYNSRIGILRIDIDISDIRTTLQNAADTPGAVSYIVNTENTVVAVSDDDQMAALGLLEDGSPRFSYDRYWDSHELTKGQIGHHKIYYMIDRIRNTDWEMVTVIPESDLLDGALRVQFIVVLIMLIFIILTSICGTMIISWIVRRIEYLVGSMQTVQSGDLDIHLENDCKDEIGVLYDNYNTMIERTTMLMDEQYKMGQKLKSAELKALQSQINPHFLYNTLDMINWLAHAGRTGEICKAVIALSKYYRLILNRGEDVLTLEKELSHVSYYIRIQDIRYPGKLTYIQNVAPEIMNGVVPKIILQPLVENAIVHGIFEKKGKQGTIKISGWLEPDNMIRLVIEDDGIGMTAETLSHVLDGTIRSTGSGYGVKNVNARIKLMFGEAYGLTYESREGDGTKVTICFPKQEADTC